MRIADMNWMQVRDHVARDDRAVLPIGSTEQHAYLSLARRCDPGRAGRSRGGRAARRAGVSVTQLRPDAELRRLSRHRDAAHVDAVRGRHRCPRWHRALRLQADHRSSTVMAAIRRPTAPCSNGWTDIAACKSNGTTGGTRRRRWQRCRRSTRSPRTPPGWRISRGRGLATSRCPATQKPMMSLDALPAARSGREEGAARRRQLRRPLSTQRRGHAGDLWQVAVDGNARSHRRQLGLTGAAGQRCSASSSSACCRRSS